MYQLRRREGDRRLRTFKDHVEHCVRRAMEHGEDADKKIEELTAAVEQFLRVW